MKMKITINEKACIGCGVCEVRCGQCFKLEEDVAKVIKDECDGCDLNEIANDCPVQAIKIETEKK